MPPVSSQYVSFTFQPASNHLINCNSILSAAFPPSSSPDRWLTHSNHRLPACSLHSSAYSLPPFILISTPRTALCPACHHPSLRPCLPVLLLPLFIHTSMYVCVCEICSQLCTWWKLIFQKLPYS